MFAKLFRTDRQIFSWAMYDWANSVCATTVMAAFFPAFFKDYWSAGVESTLTTARLGFANSATSLIVAFLAPVLGALSDYRGLKKSFTIGFMLFACVPCILFYWIPKGDWYSALLLFSFVMIGFNASLVFYDSLLPSVSDNKTSDYASSLGYSLGYLGGGVLFAINVLMTVNPGLFHLSDIAEAVRVSFVSVAIWWILFSIPMMIHVQEKVSGRVLKEPLFKHIKMSFAQVWQTAKSVRKKRNVFLFLLAYWLYIDGVYTVITMAVDYGKSINLPTADLMKALLLVQFIGFPSALLSSKLADKFGCRVPILISVLAYAIAVILATKMESSAHFFMLSLMIGVVQGGVQALSRSLFAKMIPQEASGEYFGLFNLIGKFAAILGPLLVGFGAYLSGEPRYGMLGLLVLFVIGGSLLWKVKEPI